MNMMKWKKFDWHIEIGNACQVEIFGSYFTAELKI